MSANGWVGLRVLRVQALMTKLQTQRTQVENLERQLASVQNGLSWEIASKGDINNALQRARAKLKKKEEQLATMERLMRESIDDFRAADRLKTESKSALEYWSSWGKGAAAVTGFTSLAMAGKDALWNKVGDVFGTGKGVGSTGTDVLVLMPESSYHGTPDPMQRKLNVKDLKKLAANAMGVINSTSGKLSETMDSIPARSKELWNEFQDTKAKEIENAREQGLEGQKPFPGLQMWNYKAYQEQKKAYMSTLSEEEKAAYLASLMDEEEKEKSTFDKIKDGLCKGINDFIEGEKENWSGFMEETGDWVENQVEDFQTNWDGVVSDVNDFVDEHPSVQYTLDTAESFGKTMGDAISGSMALAKGDYIKFASKTYSAWNNITDTGQNANALLSHGIGNLFGALGNEDEAQFWKEYAASEADKDGIKNELVPALGSGAGTVIDVLDTVNATYSTVTGLTSLVSGVAEAESIGEVFQSFSSWKTSDGSAISSPMPVRSLR